MAANSAVINNAVQDQEIISRLQHATRSYGPFLPEYEMIKIKGVLSLRAKIYIPYLPDRVDNPLGRVLGKNGLNIKRLRKVTDIDWLVDSNWFRFHHVYKRAGWIPEDVDADATLVQITAPGVTQEEETRLILACRLFHILMKSEKEFYEVVGREPRQV